MMYPPMLRPIIMIDNDFLIFLHVISKLLLFGFESHNVHISFGRKSVSAEVSIFQNVDLLTSTTIVRWRFHILWRFANEIGELRLVSSSITRGVSSLLFKLFLSAFSFVLLSSSQLSLIRAVVGSFRLTACIMRVKLSHMFDYYFFFFDFWFGQFERWSPNAEPAYNKK